MFDEGYYQGIWGTVHRHDYCESLAAQLVADYGRCRILDIGTGCGYLVKRLREMGCDAWGLEISEHALANRCSAYVVPGDVRDIPFRAGRFDVVHSQGLWEYVPERDIARAVEEIHRAGRAQRHNIDTSEGTWFDGFVTWRPRAWWDERLKGQKILIACPNYEGKEFCFERWIAAAEALDWPNKELLVVDNSPAPDFYYRWRDRVPMTRLELPNEGPNRKIALSMEYIRERFLAGEYVWWANIEADVIVPPQTIRSLLSAGPEYDWLSHNYPARGNDKQIMSGFGCSLFSRRIAQETFADAPEGSTTDGWWWNHKIKLADYRTFEAWNVLDIQHLN